jgi:tetratricopeptide (TPR) repeat protein
MSKTLCALFVSMLIVAACDSQPAPAQRVTALPPTSTATSAPSSTPRPTATPTLIPTATPLPEVRLQQAAQAVHDGDYDTAIQQYQAMLGLGRSEPAAIELAKTQLQAGYLADAVGSFQRFIDQYGTSDRLAEAWFGLGEAYFAQEDWPKSIDAYQKYLDLRPNLITSYVQERIGDANVQLGDLDPAAGAYASAIASAITVSDAAGLREKLALTYRQLRSSPPIARRSCTKAGKR